MKIDIRKISRDIGALEELLFSLTPKQLNIEFGEFEFNSEIEFSGHIKSLSKTKMNLKGVLQTTAISSCDRCLDEIKTKIKTDLDVIFISTYGLDVSPEDLIYDENYYYEGYNLNIDKAIIDAIILALPLKKLCTPDCKGFCPICKTNLNINSCNCETKIKKPSKFDELKKLL